MKLLARSLAAALALAPLAAAQEGGPFAYPQDYAHRSGLHRNAEGEATLVHGHTVSVPGAPSLRVFFEELDVPGGGWLDVRSPIDGQVHRLTAAEAAKWGHSSGYFNGDTLVLELWAAPGERASFAVSHLLVGLTNFPPSICGADDRVPSSDNRAMRFLNSSGTSACTGWLAGPDDCAFCAGHCFPTFSSTAEVNVPPSTAGGSLQHPPLEDQFPIDPTSLVWTNGGLGNDWAISFVLPNNLGQTPTSLWGHYELGFFDPLPGETIRITGFGADSGVDNQTNQTNSGPFVSASGTQLTYEVDTEGGNSGSPVIHESTGQVVGIHTNGGCGPGGGSNLGTSLLNLNFQSAWTDNCAQGPAGVPVASFTTSATVVVEGQPVHFKDSSTGIPSSWEWDFDDDGAVDSTAKKPTHTYEDPGVYTVSLTVSNEFGTDTITMPDLVTVNPVSPIGLPYAENFQDGLSADGDWLFVSSNEFGAIEAGSSGSASPVSGSPSLTMASSSDGQYVQNDAILFVDMTDVASATLTYWFKQTNDEPDPEDGLFLNDGITEVQVVNHGTGASGWSERSVDLIATALDEGLVLNDDFRVIWRQYDNFTLGTDGHVIDDVSIQAVTSLSGSVPLLSATFGGTQELDLDGGVGLAGAPYLVLGSISGTKPGVVFSDLPIPLNQDFYLAQTALAPNSFPLSDSIGLLNANGKGECKFTIPAGASGFAGHLFHHAFVTGDPKTQTLDTVSNAVSLLIIP